MLTRTQTDVLAHELKFNAFSRTRALSGVITVLADDEFLVSTLIGADDLDREIVFRSKPDGGIRPGWNGSLRALEKRCQLFDGLEASYFEFSAKFDFNPCFWFLLQSGANLVDRVVTLKEASERMAIATDIMAMQYGAYVAIVDIRHYFRDITPSQVYRLLGPEGLDISSALLEDICSDVEANCGLVQSSLTSNLISRLILTSFDQWVVDNGLPIQRFQDDIRCFGPDKLTAEYLSHRVTQFLVSLGFSVNAKKCTVESPGRLTWVRAGTVWGRLPIERYEMSVRDAEDQDQFLDNTLSDGTSRIRKSRSHFDRKVDWEEIYRVHHGPGADWETPQLSRLTYFHMGRISSNTLVSDCKDLTIHHPSCLQSIFHGMSLSDKDSAAFVGFGAVQDRVPKEDDRLCAFLASSDQQRLQLAREWNDQGISCRAIRQGVISYLPDCEESVDIAAKMLSRSPWTAEVTSVLQIAQRNNGAASSVLRSMVHNRNPRHGIISDALESVEVL